MMDVVLGKAHSTRRFMVLGAVGGLLAAAIAAVIGPGSLPGVAGLLAILVGILGSIGERSDV
jgi:hypothetical protein